MSIDNVLTAIQEWNLARKNPETARKLLSQGNSFFLEATGSLLPNPDTPSIPAQPFYHCYFGVENDKLVMFLIHRGLDNENNKGLETSIVHAKLVQTATPSAENGTTIPDAEAIERIERWNRMREVWLGQQIHTPAGVHQAFVIPTIGLENGKKYLAFFAMKTKRRFLVADLVLWDLAPITPGSPGSVEFKDTVNLFPPFSDKDELNKDNFQVLKIALPETLAV